MNGSYILNVDWLALYGAHALPIDLAPAGVEVYRSPSEEMFDLCLSKDDRITAEVAAGTAAAMRKKFEHGISIECQAYGTKQYSVLANVYIGRETFGFLQVYPRVSTLPRNAFIFKVANRFLYRVDWVKTLQLVFTELHLHPFSISRLDLAADFNKFACGLHPIEFISEFMQGTLKHKGRGTGHVDFVQKYAYKASAHTIEDYINYNALTIGKRSSDAHCYLYNKSLELQEVKMKEYIKESWEKAGFDVEDVWRLEVTCSARALRWVDKVSGEICKFTFEDIVHPTPTLSISTLYHMLIHSLFFFFYPTGQQNISREHMIDLFGEEIEVERSVLRSSNSSNRTERMLIKGLATMAKKYRGMDLQDMYDAERLASRMVETCHLAKWYARKKPLWNDDKFKV